MSAASPADPYGYDARVSDDLDPTGAPATGVQLLADALLHRMMEDTLLLIGTGQFNSDGDEYQEYGIDVRQWVGENITAGAAQLKGAKLAVVFAREPGIDQGSIRVTVGTDPVRDGLYVFTISVSAHTTNGLPLALVVGVNQVTVDILSQGR